MKSLFFAIALFSSTIASAQNSLKVEYHAVGKYTNETDILFDDSQMLAISGERSKYYSVRQERFEQYIDSMQRANPNIDMMEIRGGKGTPKEGFMYVIFKNYPKTGVLTHIEKKGMENYLYEEAIPAPEWQLVEGDTTILTYACQKAVAHFRGRVWTAWYAPELAYDNGPWKLGGLPGLILKADEKDGIFSFTATGIEKADAENLKPQNLHYTHCTRKEFTTLLEDYYGDRYRFAMRQLGLMDGNETSTGIPQETPCLLDPAEN